MAEPRILRIYLDEIPLTRARRGNFNFVNRIRTAFEAEDFRVELRENSRAERLKSAARRGYSLFLMDDPFHDRALTMRKAYFYPFWRIEKVAERWNFEVARSAFDADAVDPRAAERFCRTWRNELFGHGLARVGADGYVYVPLQGRLTERRSFQSASPLEMLRQILDHDRDRRVVATLHPAESYTEDELNALSALAGAEGRLHLSRKPMGELLARCDYVATENSAVALQGFFLRKPAVLFARIDFHHIAARVHDLGAPAALDAAPDLAPDYDRYLYWFLRQTAISGAAEDAEVRILSTVRRHGWQI